MSLPNQLTVLRILLTPVIISLLVIESYETRAWALGLFVLASLTDWYDGYFARKYKSVSAWGKFLDPLADKILVLSTFFAFAATGEVALWMVLVIAGRDVMITALRIYSMRTNQPLATSSFAKWKTASQMAVIYLILIYLVIREKAAADGMGLGFAQRWESWQVIEKSMYFVTFITATTGLHYLFENRQHLRGFVLSFLRLFLPTNFLS